MIKFNQKILLGPYKALSNSFGLETIKATDTGLGFIGTVLNSKINTFSFGINSNNKLEVAQVTLTDGRILDCHLE